MLYLISYDVAEPDYNRDAVEKVIESLGEFRKVLTTTYFVSTASGTSEISNAIGTQIEEKDSFVVIDMVGHIYGSLDDEHWSWLKSTM